MLQAALLVAGGLLACSWVVGFFVCHAVVASSGRAARPLAELFDGPTLVTAALFAAFYAICLRAYVRQRAGGAGGVVPRVVRAVPYLIAVGLAVGLYTGQRAASAWQASVLSSAQGTCDDLVGAGRIVPAALDTCIDTALLCGREPPGRVPPMGLTRASACVLEKLQVPAAR